MAKHGKNYMNSLSMIEKGKQYSISEAVKLVKETSKVKFDATVEVSFNLNVDPRHADQQIRGAMVLPNGTGRSQKVLVITQGAKEEEARNAGADFVGGKEMLDEIKKGWFDFDVIVATPDMMGELGTLGKILGPKGLMPNPKAGTVTMDVTKAIADIKAGKIEYRLDKTNIVHVPLGKASFSEEALQENFKALMDAIMKAKPSAVKGAYLKSITLTSTMGPGVKVSTAKFV